VSEVSSFRVFHSFFRSTLDAMQQSITQIASVVWESESFSDDEDEKLHTNGFLVWEERSIFITEGKIYESVPYETIPILSGKGSSSLIDTTRVELKTKISAVGLLRDYERIARLGKGYLLCFWTSTEQYKSFYAGATAVSIKHAKGAQMKL
jgi:hypothetical protein